jgi:5-methylcytosine-specific restriction endonuclease McrA
MPKNPSSVKRNKVMRLLRKYNLIKKAGGKCVICGYKKNLAGLAFHHINEKGARLSGNYLIGMSVKGAEEELNRCVLVCHNCHSEIHHPDLPLNVIAQMCKLIAAHKLTHNQAYKQFFDR